MPNPPRSEAPHDVAIVGGSAAGLAAGSRVGAMVAADLAQEDRRARAEAAGGAAFDRAFWDRHWSAERAIPEEPEANPYLACELDHLEPGTALDAGCGEGAEALWLAEAGWVVHGAEISRRALDGAQRRGADAGLATRLHWHEVDLTTWSPPRRFDLVVTSYAHAAIPQLDLYARLQDWVAPGGTLLVVAHGHEEHGHHGSDHRAGSERGEGPPPAAIVTPEAIIAVLRDGDWEVASAYEADRRVVRHGEERTLRDVVVRATRRA